MSGLYEYLEAKGVVELEEAWGRAGLMAAAKSRLGKKRPTINPSVRTSIVKSDRAVKRMGNAKLRMGLKNVQPGGGVVTTDAKPISKAAQNLKAVRGGKGQVQGAANRLKNLRATNPVAAGVAKPPTVAAKPQGLASKVGAGVQKAKFALHQRPGLKSGLKAGGAVAAGAAAAGAGVAGAMALRKRLAARRQARQQNVIGASSDVISDLTEAAALTVIYKDGR